MKLHHTITTSFSICLSLSIQTKKMRYKANCEDEDEEEAITTTHKKKSPPTIPECFSIYHHNHFSHRMWKENNRATWHIIWGIRGRSWEIFVLDYWTVSRWNAFSRNKDCLFLARQSDKITFLILQANWKSSQM